MNNLINKIILKRKLSVLSTRKIITTSIILFLFIGIINIHYIKSLGGGTILDVVFFSFCGPAITEFPNFVALQWLCIQLVMLLLFSNFIFYQTFYMGIYELPRIGNRTLWWITQVFDLVVKVFEFYLVGFLIIFLLSLTFIKNRLLSHIDVRLYSNIDYKTVILMFFIIFVSSVSIILFQSVFSIILKNSVPSLVFIIIMHIFAINSGKINVLLVKWILENHSMIIRSSLFDFGNASFSIRWAFTYDICFLVITFLLGLAIIKKLDIY